MNLRMVLERTRARLSLGGVIVVLYVGTLAGQEMTAEQVVDACAEAMGGWERIESIRTLRLTYTLPDHGGSQSVTEIARPNRVRLGDAVVFDGSRAAILGGAPGPNGSPRPAEPVDREEWKDFEVDIGRYFPAFFDYPAEYLGKEFFAGIETYVLGVSLPLGGHMTYFIETASNLPLMVEHSMTMYGNKYRDQRVFGSYRDVDGVMYPHEYSYYSPHWRQMLYLEMDGVEINPNLGEDRFSVPSGVYDNPG